MIHRLDLWYTALYPFLVVVIYARIDNTESSILIRDVVFFSADMRVVRSVRTPSDLDESAREADNGVRRLRVTDVTIDQDGSGVLAVDDLVLSHRLLQFMGRLVRRVMRDDYVQLFA